MQSEFLSCKIHEKITGLAIPDPEIDPPNEEDDQFVCLDIEGVEVTELVERSNLGPPEDEGALAAQPDDVALPEDLLLYGDGVDLEQPSSSDGMNASENESDGEAELLIDALRQRS
eukprot:jgi/Botrbrau1/13691/Bobra.0261s0001.1